MNELGRNPRNDDELDLEDDTQTQLVKLAPHSPDLPGSMPTYTLSPDNLLALLETQRGQSELCQQVNVWTRRHTGGIRGPQRYQDNPNARHHEMFAPLIIGKDDGRYKHITMALLDSGNLLQQPAINASLHQSLGVEVDKTNVVARGANQLSINIEGISKGIYLKFPNLRTSFLVRPLVVKNLASPLNLGSKFNFEFMLTPQLVEQDVNTGLKHNQYKIQGKKGKLFSRLVMVSAIKPYLQDDEMFMKILNQWPDEGSIGQHTLAESRKKWGWNPILKTERVETIKPRKKEDGTLQNLEYQGTTQEGSTHLTPTDIGHKESKMMTSSDRTEETTTINRVMKLARLTSNAQHYTQPEPSEGLELLPDGSLPHKTIPGPKEVPTNDHLKTTIPLPKFSLSSLEKVRNLGVTQMEHHVGRNLEE